jgi:hypothetical protein
LVIIVVRGVAIIIVRVSRVVVGIPISVIVRIIAVGIRWIIVISVVRIEPGIQSPPKAIEEDKDLMVVEM